MQVKATNNLYPLKTQVYPKFGSSLYVAFRQYSHHLQIATYPQITPGGSIAIKRPDNTGSQHPKKPMPIITILPTLPNIKVSAHQSGWHNNQFKMTGSSISPNTPHANLRNSSNPHQSTIVCHVTTLLRANNQTINSKPTSHHNRYLKICGIATQTGFTNPQNSKEIYGKPLQKALPTNCQELLPMGNTNLAHQSSSTKLTLVPAAPTPNTSITPAHAQTAFETTRKCATRKSANSSTSPTFWEIHQSHTKNRHNTQLCTSKTQKTRQNYHNAHKHHQPIKHLRSNMPSKSHQAQITHHQNTITSDPCTCNNACKITQSAPRVCKPTTGQKPKPGLPNPRLHSLFIAVTRDLVHHRCQSTKVPPPHKHSNQATKPRLPANSWYHTKSKISAKDAKPLATQLTKNKPKKQQTTLNMGFHLAIIKAPNTIHTKLPSRKRNTIPNLHTQIYNLIPQTSLQELTVPLIVTAKSTATHFNQPKQISTQLQIQNATINQHASIQKPIASTKILAFKMRAQHNPCISDIPLNQPTLPEIPKLKHNHHQVSNQIVKSLNGYIVYKIKLQTNAETYKPQISKSTQVSETNNTKNVTWVTHKSPLTHYTMPERQLYKYYNPHPKYNHTVMNMNHASIKVLQNATTMASPTDK
eukprot:gene13100-8946_t